MRLRYAKFIVFSMNLYEASVWRFDFLATDTSLFNIRPQNATSAKLRLSYSSKGEKKVTSYEIKNMMKKIM